MNIRVSNEIVSQVIAMLQDDHSVEGGMKLWTDNKQYLTPEQAEQIEQAAAKAAEQRADPLRFMHHPGTFS